jgi:hypothetical protein
MLYHLSHVSVLVIKYRGNGAFFSPKISVISGRCKNLGIFKRDKLKLSINFCRTNELIRMVYSRFFAHIS